MTKRKMSHMNMMSCHAGSAAAFCAHFSMHTTSRSIAIILDAMLVASIIIFGLVNLTIQRGFLVLLAGQLICKATKTPRMLQHA